MKKDQHLPTIVKLGNVGDSTAVFDKALKEVADADEETRCYRSLLSLFVVGNDVLGVFKLEWW